MDIRDIYRVGLLSAETLVKQKPPYIIGVITKAYLETFTDDNKKPHDKCVIELDEGETRIQLNFGNAKTLMKQIGYETDEWIGVKVKVSTKKVSYKNKTVDGLHVEKASK
jgi:hypothetical protein